MTGFSCELPLEVVKKVLLEHYNVLDNYHKIWYNKDNNSIVLEAVYASDEILTEPSNSDSEDIFS